jgi:NitT/TauT family transport system ATP-binding protein
MSYIKFDDVSYAYVDNNESFLALEHVNLEIAEGEFVCLVGHSGCGKSTMLSLLAGLVKPTSGQVLVDGKAIEGPSLTRSMVFQNYSLFPWQTVLKNVTFALSKTHKVMTKEEQNSQAMKILEQVGVADSANKFPFQLSGGMRQRVAIARALAIDAPIMLLDEPFGALDPMIRRKLQQLLLDLWGESCCKTAVFVTHDIDEALILADRIIFMEPKHIVADFKLNRTKQKSAEYASQSKELSSIKNKVLNLFQTTATNAEEF